VGSLDLVYVDESTKAVLEESSLVFQAIDPAGTARSPEKPKGSVHPVRPAKGKDSPAPRPADDLSVFDGPVYTESQVIAAYEAGDLIPKPEAETKPAPAPAKPPKAEHPHEIHSPRRPPDKPIESVVRGLQTQARPGEQDALRSPLVLGLSIGGIILVLVTGVFWFLIGREQASRLYDRAVAEMNDGQYAQSIASFEQFLQQYSGHSLHRQAERGLDRAIVQREISGATPAWKHGLEQLQTLIAHHRNEPDFAEMHPQIHRYAEEISLGSARSAESSRDQVLLTVSEDAQVLLERFADANAPPTAAIARIKEARVAAVIAIGKQKIFDDGMAAIEAGLAAKKPMIALAEREKLVRAFDGFASQKRVKDALQKALDLERSVIVADDRERAAEITDIAPPEEPASLGLFLTRTRTDETSQGAVAYVLAKDCCYAVDSVTGELVWRRVIGFEPPFFPVTVSASQAGVLMYDANLQSLVCCQPLTGKLIWRQKLDARPRSAPLIHEGQIYLPTNDRSLCRIDVETGRLTERISFSQNIQGPPTLTVDGNHLLVPGEAAMIYALSMRPLAAAAMTFTDHAAGAIQASPVGLGKLYLLCENDKSDSAALRLWNASNPKLPLVELTTKPIRTRGQVREAPVLRGNQLVVPSTGEQLAAFSVTDDAGREGLAPIGQYRVQEGDDQNQKQPAEAGLSPEKPIQVANKSGPRVPLYLALGPDRQFWTASSAFRRLEIGADAIHLDSKMVAPGIASQRLQAIGDQFFVGRKAPFNDAVTFSAVDRDRMVIPWRAVLGSQLLQVVPGRNGGAVAVSEAGQIVILGSERLRQGGLDQKAAVELELPPVNQPLVTSQLHDGRIFVAAVGAATQVWIIGPGGQLELTTKFGKGDLIQAGAILLDEGLVISLPGRLKVIPLTSGRKAIQDWMVPADGKAPPACRFLVRLDGDELLAGFEDGLLTHIQVRTTDVPHLAETAKLQLAEPIDIPARLRGDNLLVADTAGNVLMLNWRTFDQEGKRQLPAPIRGAWPLESSWLVWSGDSKLSLLSDGRDLPVRWSFDLKELSIAGEPVQDGDLIWIACRDGTVIGVNSQSGVETRRLRVPQSLTMGLKKLDDRWFAVACDGTLYRLNLAER
ncbi:MAG TPA: PQQ-binding-like beta-propeller repeat protein, partial [Schlesneria sp.]